MNGEKIKRWWKAAGIRAIKTFMQTAIATIGTSMFLEDVNWLAVLSASALAGLLSLMTSLAGLPELNENKQEAEDEVIDPMQPAVDSDKSTADEGADEPKDSDKPGTDA